MATAVDHEDLIENRNYVGWFSLLFRTPTYERVLLVSLGVSLGLYLLGYAIAALGGVDYPKAPAYVGLFAVFGMTAALGVADATYTDVWNEVRVAFAVDDDAYRLVVCPGLDRMHDDERILLYAAALAVPYSYVVLVSYLPLDWPLREVAVELFLGGTLTYEPGIGAVALVWLYGAASAVLIATIVNGFIEHLTLVREVAELPFRDVHASAVELAPLARFSAASATAWFAGVSLVVLWMEFGIGEVVGTTFIGLLVLTGLVFFIAPQLILHDALVDAKHAELYEIRREYHDLLDNSRPGGQTSDGISTRLELTDRRLDAAKAIDTWVYDLSSISKLVAASLIPWVTLLKDVRSLIGIP